MSFTLPSLPYAYDALEPFIDTKTMEIHHQKHHQAYVDGLNSALSAYPDLQKQTLENLLMSIDQLPEALKKPMEDFGGGHYNHMLFWEIMHPGKPDNKCVGDLATHINAQFGSLDQFKAAFITAGKSIFGSGWVWLVLDNKDSLSIIKSANQKTPLTKTTTPLLGLDVWEHAYYLHYQNRRIDYMQAWWHVVNWNKVEERYQKTR